MGYTSQRWLFISLIIINYSFGNCFRLQRSQSKTRINPDHEYHGLFHGMNPVDSLETQKFIKNLKENQKDADAWELNMDQYKTVRF